MAAGYIKASGEPAIVMQAGVVGMVNAMGQIYNASKEQTPLVVYSYRTDQTRRAGRDGFEEVREPGAARPADHQIHLAGAARRHDPRDGAPRLQGGVDAALRPRLHLLALGLQRREGAHRDHRAGAGRSAHAGAARPGRGRARRQAPGRSQDAAADRRRRDHQGQGGGEGGEARRAARHAGDAGAPALRQLPRDASALGRQHAGRHAELAELSAQRRRHHQCRQQVAAQRPGADRAARAEIHRHAHRRRQHGQRDAHRGAAGRRCRPRPRRPDHGGRAAA